MTDANEHIRKEAIARFVKIECDDAQLSDWEDLTDWLEQAPEHVRAYEAVVISDNGLSALGTYENGSVQTIPPAASNDNLRKGFAAVVAAAAAVIAAFWLWPAQSAPEFQIFETAPGEVRNIALNGETQVTLNSDTKIVIDMSGQREARMERGEALFVVEHDDDAPFIVELGPERLVDAGTVFNIVRTGQEYSVAVSEGEVILNPHGAAVSVEPGERLTGTIGKTDVQVHEIEAATIADWTTGRLIFSNAPLNEVASKIERSIGKTVKVAPNAAHIRFTGTIKLTNDENEIFEGLSAMTGISATVADDAWQLSR